jgi:hypothetical protein
MTPEEHNLLLLAGIGCLLLLAWLARHRDCSCEKCSFHVNEYRMKLEADRVERHRAFHKAFRIAWTEEACSACRNGGLGDKP